MVFLKGEDPLVSKSSLKCLTALTQRSEEARQFLVDYKGILTDTFVCKYTIVLGPRQMFRLLFDYSWKYIQIQSVFSLSLLFNSCILSFSFFDDAHFAFCVLKYFLFVKAARVIIWYMDI